MANVGKYHIMKKCKLRNAVIWKPKDIVNWGNVLQCNNCNPSIVLNLLILECALKKLF